MSGGSRLKKNLIYQILYQILNTSIPLITSPYLARVLGATQQGIFSYTHSIVNYFTLFALLGVANYGTRTIASCGDNKEKKSDNFWNIYAFQCTTSVLAIIIYAIYLVQICRENQLVALLQGFYLLGSLVDVSWLFFGSEKFDITVKRSVVIRLLSFFCIMFFVKSQSDLWLYTIIMAGGTFLSCMILWSQMGRLISYNGVRYIRFSKIRTHIKPNLVLFIPLLAMTVFHVMDKTMLGYLSTYEETGYYYNADKVINIPISIINGVSTVMLPRMSALAQKGNENESNRVFNISVEAIVLVSAAFAFGIASISKEFTPIFFGKGFESCVLLIIVLAPVLIIKSLSQTSRMQYLIPQHQEKIFIQSVFAGAIVNFCVNLTLIPRLGAMGAVVGTLIAELVTCIWQYAKMRKMIPIGRTLLKSSMYLLFGIVMFIGVRFVATLTTSRVLGLGLEIIIGGCIYLICCFIFWYITNNPLRSVIFNRKKK